MTVNDVLNIMESDQPIQIILVDLEGREFVMYDGRLEDMDEHNVWDSWEPVKILTPDDGNGTIRFVC